MVEKGDNSMDTVEDCRHFLAQAGWAASESHDLTGPTREWLVLGVNGPHTIEARGATPLDAWLLAVEEARALGMN
jgi:hypothetical protein